MFLIDHKRVTLLSYISRVTSSKMTQSETQILVFRTAAWPVISYPCVNAAECSYLSRGEPCSHPQPSLCRPLLQLLQVTLCSEPILHPARSPPQLANQTRTLCFPPSHPVMKTPHCTLAQHRSQSTPLKIPFQFSQLIVGNCSLTTACQPAVHWPKIIVSSCPGLSRLLMTMSCKTVSKTLLKSGHVTPTAFLLPTRSVALSQKEKRLVSDDLLLTNPCWLFCSYPRYRRGAYNRLFDCLFHVLAGSWLDYKTLDSAFSPCYG